MCLRDGNDHLQPFAARNMAIFLAMTAHVTVGSPITIPTVNPCAACLPKMWPVHQLSSTTILVLTVLRKSFLMKDEANVIWEPQLPLHQLLVLFAHKLMTNENMKVIPGQKDMKHNVLIFPLSQKESLLMLL